MSAFSGLEDGQDIAYARGAHDILEKAAACRQATGCSYIVWERPNGGRLAPYGGHDTTMGPLGANVAVADGGRRLTETHGAMVLADFDSAARAPGYRPVAPKPREPVQAPGLAPDAPSLDLG